MALKELTAQSRRQNIVKYEGKQATVSAVIKKYTTRCEVIGKTKCCGFAN